MKVYLAGPWVNRAQAKAFANNLHVAGFKLTSRWYDQHDDTHDPIELSKQAVRDLNDVHEADALVVLNLTKSEGKATEVGYALALGKTVIAVGGERKNNIFYYLPEVTFVDELNGVVSKLRSL